MADVSVFNVRRFIAGECVDHDHGFSWQPEFPTCAEKVQLLIFRSHRLCRFYYRYGYGPTIVPVTTKLGL